MLKKWSELPNFLKTEEVRPYWETLNKKRITLFFKRSFDFTIAVLLLILLCIPMLIIAVLIRIDSPGPAMFRQTRVTAYGKRFKIHKFRTMVANAEKNGPALTIGQDKRITRIGKKLRNRRLDELPQLLDVLTGNMSFVGVRPEDEKYVREYAPKYNATLLLPAGITSMTSILFQDEAKILEDSLDPDETYTKEILPQKMEHNLNYLKNLSLKNDFSTLIKTLKVLKK